MHILIVEDNVGIAGHLYDYLMSHDHEVEAVSDGMVGLGAAAGGNFDAIVLDLRLPRLNGFELCRRLRNDYHCDTPVLMLTALDSLEDKLAGFEAGADDYLVKPFAMREVEARLKALASRRSGQVVKQTLRVGALHYDSESMTVRVHDTEVRLPPKCIHILAAMMEHPNRTFTRADLERAGWGNESSRYESVRTHISLLRRTLMRAGSTDPIVTLHGLGYRINPSLINGSGPGNA